MALEDARYQSAAMPQSAPFLIDSPFKRELDKLRGRIYTILEATFADAVQRDAVKELIKKEFSTALNSCRESLRSI